MNTFLPPLSVKGMKTLQKELFNKTVQVPAIKIQPQQCALFMKNFKKKALRHFGIKGICNATPEGDSKLLLLQPIELSDEELKWITDNKGTMTSENIQMTYKNFSSHEILQSVLPIEAVKDIPSSFEQIGHIAHLNLREEQLPYKELIGQVILDKQPGIETVVNKVANIDETFRFFKMDILAGKDDMITNVKENGCTFTFDFSKVYWNSRLHTEHKRIIDILKSNDIVLDVFAGVGPFAIPACRKGCNLHANDLNPNAYSALINNAKENKAKNLQAYCLDGREFIKRVVTKLIIDYKGQEGPIVSHVIMNLPAIAVEFLDVFKGLFASLPLNARSATVLPKIHCYCFSKSIDPIRDAVQKVEQFLGSELQANCYDVFNVRDVAPNKAMMRVSFDLPFSVAYWEGETTDMEETSTDECENHQLSIGRKRIGNDESNVDSNSDHEGLGCSPPTAKKEKL